MLILQKEKIQFIAWRIIKNRIEQNQKQEKKIKNNNCNAGANETLPNLTVTPMLLMPQLMDTTTTDNNNNNDAVRKKQCKKQNNEEHH